MGISAIFFAFHDYGHRNIIVSFVAGFITGGIWIVLTVGALILWIFLMILFISLYDERKEAIQRRERKIEIQRSHAPGNICAILAGIITVAVWFAALEFIKTIPALGEQVTFLFRDWDDD